MGDPTPVYVILEGVVGGEVEAPFSLSWVRVPYDWQTELAYAEAVGATDLEGYTVELRDGTYRGNPAAGEKPDYHHRPRA